jgi:DNA-binding MurR/RpiR family transcriptional regulator
VFSFPPYAAPSIELVRDAKRLHVPTFVVSDKLTSQAARQADHVLCTRSDNMMYTNAIASVTVLLNALVTWSALLAPDRASKAVQHINALLDD